MYDRLYVEDGVVWLRGEGSGSDVSYEAAEAMTRDELCETLNLWPSVVGKMLRRAEKLSESLG